MPVVWHKLVGKYLARISLQPLGKDAFKGIEICGFVKNGRAGIPAIHRVVEATRLIRSFRTSHGVNLVDGILRENDS